MPKPLWSYRAAGSARWRGAPAAGWRNSSSAEEQQEGASHRSAQQQLEATESSWQQVLEATRLEQQQVQELAEALALQQRTRSRLEQEQTQLEREIARLDSRRETLQESRGTGALRVLLEAGMDGIHGPVAQLGEVEERVRLALEVAAGGRLGQVVVDDDRIAARAIELLKSRRAGRLTFLPLNKIRGGSGSGSSGSGGAALQRGGAAGGPASGGLVGKAVDLVGYEPVYTEVFRYVFGDTLVFDSLANARRELGRCRAVTLDGELLEKSGAMTGGSLQQRGSQLSFGRSQDGDEAAPLRQRLLELGESLLACRRKEAELGQQLEALRPRLLSHQQRQAGLEAERSAAQRALAPQLQRQQQLGSRLGQLQEALQSDLQRQQQLESLLLPLQQQRIALEEAEAAVQSSGDAARWQGRIRSGAAPWQPSSSSCKPALAKAAAPAMPPKPSWPPSARPCNSANGNCNASARRSNRWPNSSVATSCAWNNWSGNCLSRGRRFPQKCGRQGSLPYRRSCAACRPGWKPSNR